MDGKEILVKPTLENLVSISGQLLRNCESSPETILEDLEHLSLRVQDARSLVIDIIKDKECPEKLEPSR